jgi:hypothetical protein
MNTKLTLRIDEMLVKQAKSEAKLRGKSVSQMFSEFVEGLSARRTVKSSLPPITASLIGTLKGQQVTEEDYKKHLREKYL